MRQMQTDVVHRSPCAAFHADRWVAAIDGYMPGTAPFAAVPSWQVALPTPTVVPGALAATPGVPVLPGMKGIASTAKHNGIRRLREPST